MEETKTFVFLDLETSGLPHTELGPTKITEIALIAVSRAHILDKHNGTSKENNEQSDFVPRVLHKLSLLMYPCKMIQPKASTITGLTNENLEGQKPFDESLHQVMCNFLDRLEKPICLVAHNGNTFDFPILQSELKKINKDLPEDVFCADTLPGFRELLGNQELKDCKSDQNDDPLSGITPLSGQPSAASLLPKCGWSNEEYDNELMKATELAEKLDQEHSGSSFNVVNLEKKLQIEMDRIRKMNESTPVKRNRKHMAEKLGARPKLVKDHQQPKRKLYNLEALFETLTKRKLVDSHRAEGDCLALLACVTAVGQPIMEWLDNNRKPFRSVIKKW